MSYPATDRLTEVLAVPAMVGGGALVAVQSQINGELAHALGSGPRAGVGAGLVSFGTGLVVLVAIAVLVPRVGRGVRAVPGLLRRGTLRWWQLVGGVAGALLVASQGLTVPVIGVALFTVAIVAGQTSTATLVDQLGLGPAGRVPVTVGRLVGAAVTLAAVVLSVAGRLFGTDALGASVIALALLPLAAGAGTSFQQAVNGKVSAEIGPVAATLNNFAVGTLALVALLLASLLLPGRLAGLPHSWWLYVGGPIGIVFIVAAAALVKVHGVLVLGLCTIAGQVGASLVIDAVIGEHLGPATVAGAVLALVGVLIGFAANRRARAGRDAPASA